MSLHTMSVIFPYGELPDTRTWLPESRMLYPRPGRDLQIWATLCINGPMQHSQQTGLPFCQAIYEQKAGEITCDDGRLR